MTACAAQLWPMLGIPLVPLVPLALLVLAILPKPLLVARNVLRPPRIPTPMLQQRKMG